jgi:hypothetical protein
MGKFWYDLDGTMNQNLPLLARSLELGANFGTIWTAEWIQISPCERGCPGAKGKLGFDSDGRMDPNLLLLARKPGAKG